MVAIDQFGRGQPIQYSFLKTNSDWHMGKYLDHFKRANEHWRLVRIVIVDKDMRDIEVIRHNIPEARILLCHAHVIKWLHNTIRNSKKYGPYEDSALATIYPTRLTHGRLLTTKCIEWGLTFIVHRRKEGTMGVLEEELGLSPRNVGDGASRGSTSLQ